MAGKYLPALVKDVFHTKEALCSETTAFQLRKTPHNTGLSLQDIQQMYELPNFQNDLHYFLYGRQAVNQTILPFTTISTWSRVRMQLKDPQDINLVLQPVTVEASPSVIEGKTGYTGRYNFVLLQRDVNTEDFGIQGELTFSFFVLGSYRCFRMYNCSIESNFHS